MWSIATIKTNTTRFFHPCNGGTSQITELRGRLLSGTAWNLLAAVSNQGSNFIANIFIARLLGKQMFGEYAMAQVTLLNAAILAQLCMGYTATKYVAEFRSIDKEKTGQIIGMCAFASGAMAAIGAMGMAVASPWIAIDVLKAPQLSAPLLIGTLFLLFTAINGYQAGVLVGFEAFRKLAFADLVNGMIAVGGITLGGWQWGLSGAIAGMSLAAMIRCVIYQRTLSAELRRQGVIIQWKGIRTEKNILLGFSLPAIISGYFTIPAIWLASTFLVRQPGGYAEMAVYSAASNIRLMVLFLPNIIQNVGLCILNNQKGLGDRRLYFRVFQTNVVVIFVVTLATIGLFGAFGERILILFGKDFSGGKTVLWILLVSTIPQSLTAAVYQYIQSHGRMWLSFFFMVIPSSFLFLFAAYAMRTQGAIGLSYAFLIFCVANLVCVIGLTLVINAREKWDFEHA